MSSPALNCAYCGDPLHFETNSAYFWWECRTCKIDSGVFDTRAEMYEHASRRPATPAPESPAPAPVDALRKLLREARDTVKASTVEEGITEDRRDYRRGLADRLNDWLNRNLHSELPAQGSDIGTGSETSPDAGASIRETLADELHRFLCEGGSGLEDCISQEEFRAEADRILSLLAKPGEASEPEQSPRLSVPEIFEAYAGICPTCDHDFTNPPPVAEAEQSSPADDPEKMVAKWYCVNCKTNTVSTMEGGDLVCACGHVIASYKLLKSLAAVSPNGNGGAA